MARIVTVYYPGMTRFRLQDMSFIRWLKISQALARLGHQVDIAVNEPARFHWWWPGKSLGMEPNLRRVPLRGIDYAKYDVIKTLFHVGFETVEKGGGGDHPFIISKLGSVVGPKDMEGIYFYGTARAKLFEVQQRISRAARHVAVLSRAAGTLWEETVSGENSLLLVPGAVDRDIPPPRKNPFPPGKHKRCLFSGNIYSKSSQPEAHATLTAKLNKLGSHLARRGIRLYFQGKGDTAGLDSGVVTNMGCASYEDSWQAMHFADVGVVVSAGPFMHNNESTKIYHYLRAGLPVVSESGFPNDPVVESCGSGWLVEHEDMEAMAATVALAAEAERNREAAIQYVLERHTWDRRAEVYDQVITGHFSPPGNRRPVAALKA